MFRIVCLMSALMVTGNALSAEDEQPKPGAAQDKTLVQSFEKTLPEAISDAVLIDLPLEFFLWGLGLSDARSLAVAPTAASLAYMIRKTCNDFQEQDGQKDWRISAACGAVAGALKYTGKSLALGKFDYLQPAVGALDAGTYEATSQVRGRYQTAELAAIEAMVSAAQYFQAVYFAKKAFSKGGLADSAKMGAAVGAAVSATVYTTLSWYEVSVKNAVIRAIAWAKTIANNAQDKKEEL